MVEGKSQTRLDLRSAFDQTIPLPELDFVLPGLLAGTVGMITAPGGTGKTFWLIQAAISIASHGQEVPFFGGVWEAPKYHGRVVLFFAEDPVNILFHRVRAVSKWLSNYNISELMDELEDNLEIHSLIGYQPCLMDSDGKPDKVWLDTLRRAAEGTRLLGIDPLRRWHRGNEIDNGLMMYLIQLLEGIARDSGCTIVFSHHVNKLSMLSGTGGEQGAARGASALSDGVRWQVNLIKMNKEEAVKYGVEEKMRGRFVRMEISKSNYGTALEPVWLKREDGGVLTKAIFRKIGRKDRKEKEYEREVEKCPT